jgi:hypothetical protein
MPVERVTLRLALFKRHTMLLLAGRLLKLRRRLVAGKARRGLQKRQACRRLIKMLRATLSRRRTQVTTV